MAKRSAKHVETQRVLSAQSPRPKDAFQRGVALHKQGRLREAIDCFEAALANAANPDQEAVALQKVGDASRSLGDTKLAVEFYNRALLIEPTRQEAIVPLASLYAEQGRYQDAQSLLSDKIQICEKPAALWLSLGNITRDAGDLDNAETFIREAIALKPGYPLAYGALGDLMADKGNTDAAFDAYDKAIKKDPKLDRVRYHRGLLHLACGNLKPGWREFEYRFSAMGNQVDYNHGLRKWDGSPLKGQRLLVTAEQGIGDQIGFASVFPELMAQVAKDGGQIIIECEQRLQSLFTRSFSDAQIVPMRLTQEQGRLVADYQWLHQCDDVKRYIPMGSVGRILRSDFASMPDEHAYLKPLPAQRDYWRNWIEGLGPRPKVGVCWRSSNTTGARSLQFAIKDAWIDFLKSLRMEIVSLQYDADPTEVGEIANQAGTSIHLPPDLDQKNDLDRTAALISNLDAVVTAPTAVAALSAALNVPTFKIIRDRSWTAFGKDYEPMAPACKLMRGDTAGDWPGAFAATKTALIKMTG